MWPSQALPESLSYSEVLEAHVERSPGGVVRVTVVEAMENLDEEDSMEGLTQDSAATCNPEPLDETRPCAPYMSEHLYSRGRHPCDQVDKMAVPNFVALQHRTGSQGNLAKEAPRGNGRGKECQPTTQPR